MKNILIRKLHDWLFQNNPDVLFELQHDGKLVEYLEAKVDGLGDLPEKLRSDGRPSDVVDEICMNELTQEYLPSRYNYLMEIIESDFLETFYGWKEGGVLIYAVVDLLGKCQATLNSLKFSEGNEDDRMIRYAVIGVIKEYLVGKTVDVEYLDKIDFADQSS
jgi:hypothetical protein